MVDPNWEGQLDIPGWNDVIHFYPRVTIGDEEYKLHRQRLKDKQPSNLNELQLLELQRRRESFLRFHRSPTPDIVKSLSSIMTTLDDVEDALITFSVAGKLLIKLFPRLFSRFIPLVGWSLLASDIINLFQIMSWLPFNPMSGKRTFERITDRNPLGRKAKLARLSRIKRVSPTFGEILEIAQTTDNLFGVGLCLGSILGFIQDAFFLGIKKAYGPAPRMLQSYPKWLALGALKYNTLTFLVDRELTDEEEARHMATLVMCLKYTAGDVTAIDWHPMIDQIKDIKIKAPLPGDPVTQWILKDENIDIEKYRRWPIQGTPFEASLNQLSLYAWEKLTEKLKKWWSPHSHTYLGYIVSSCLHNILYDTLLLFEGHDEYSHVFYEREARRYEMTITTSLGGKSLSNPSFDFTETEVTGTNKDILQLTPSPETRIAMVMLENEILPSPGDEGEKMSYFFSRAVSQGMGRYKEPDAKELSNLYKTIFGHGGRQFPVFPWIAGEGYITDYLKFSKAFREHIGPRFKALWPNFELFPQEARDYYIQYGQL